MAHDMRPASPATSFCDTRNEYIVHHVSKLDTLAGVAIKYGVEVADVKRLNGLVSDFEMFAHKTLRIPMSRKHPIASECIIPQNASSAKSSQNGSVSNSVQDLGNKNERKGRDKRPLSSAMNLLRGYYGLSLSEQQADNTETRMDTSPFVQEQSHQRWPSLAAEVYFSLKNNHWKPPGSLENGVNGKENEGIQLPEANGGCSQLEVAKPSGVCDVNGDRSVRRRYKPDASNPPPETCVNVEIEDDTSFMYRIRPADGLLSGTRNAGGLPLSLYKVLDGALAGVKGKESSPSMVRKSLSTSSLQDQTSTHAKLGSHNYGFSVEVKPAGPWIQNGMKNSSYLPPKVGNHRFKAALD